MGIEDSNISEYERIFGKPTRMSLFSDDEESYKTFREFIMNSPRVKYDPKKKLPFEGIKLLSYDFYILKHKSLEAMAQGKLLYYIKDVTDKECPIFGVGYYISDKNLFYLLANSIIKRTPFTDDLLKNEDNDFVKKFGHEGKYLSEDIACRTASLAASYVLGEKASYTRWIPMKTKPLAENYLYFRSADIVSKEEESFNPTTKKEIAKTKVEKVANILETLFPCRKISEVDSRHIFSINKPNVCMAKGYYDEIEDVFVILAGSRFLKDLYSNYVPSNIVMKRQIFINSSCEVKQDYCCVKNDTKIRTASLAASFVLGLKVWYNRWVDDEGKTLKDIYPLKYGNNDSNSTRIVKKPVLKKQPTGPIHFYINKSMDYGSCKAEAIYDVESKSFKVLKGAVFVSRPALSFSYTVGDYQRRLFLRKYCFLKEGCYKLREDYVFDSHNLAATYLQGAEAKGDEWQDENGTSIKDYSLDV